MFKEIFERILRTNGAVVTLCHVASDVAERVQVDIAANGVKRANPALKLPGRADSDQGSKGFFDVCFWRISLRVVCIDCRRSDVQGCSAV